MVMQVVDFGVQGPPGPVAASVASTALLAAVADTTFPDGTLAYVTGAGYYGLSRSSTATPDAYKVVATQSGTGCWLLQLPITVLNPALSQTAWFINYATGLPTNDGKTAQTPVDRASTIRARWGGPGVRPVLPGINIAIQISGNAPDFSDPIGVLWDVDMAPGGTIVIDGVTTVKRSGTINAVPNAFARTSTGQQTITDAGVSNWTPDVDQLLIDTTSGAASWVVLGGASATLCAARAQSTNAAGQATTILNAGVAQTAISATHTYQILTLPTVYFGNNQNFRMGPGSAQGGSAGNGTATALVRRLHGTSQNTKDLQICNGTCNFPQSAFPTGALVMFVECIHEQAIRTTGGVMRVNGAGIVSVNGDEFDGYTGNSAALLAGYNRRSTFMSGAAAVDQDFQVLGSFNMQANFARGDIITIGNFGRFLMGGGSGPVGYIFSAIAEVTANYDAQAVVYGTRGANPIFKLSGNTQVGFGAAVVCNVATAAATFFFDTGAASDFTFETQQVGSAVAGNGITYGPILATIANVDACGGLFSSKGSRVMAVPGTIPAVPLTWAQATWKFDPANSQGTSSDNNDGLTNATALRTFAGVVSKLGTESPHLLQSTIFTQLSGQTLNQDEIFFTPRLPFGNPAILLGTLVANGSTWSPTTVTAKNRATPQNLVLNGVPGGVVAKNLVKNVTKNSWAFVDSVAGGNATMSQPVTDASVSTVGIPAPAEDNTWANTDTYQAYTLPLCNLKAWRPTGGDVSAGGQASVGWVQNVEIADSSGAGNSEHTLVADCASLALASCRIDTRVHMTVLNGRGTGMNLINCDVAGQAVCFAGTPALYGGIYRSGASQTAGRFILDGDAIMHGTVQSLAGLLTIGTAFFDGSISINSELSNATQGTGTFVWGSGSVTVNAMASYINGTGSTFASTLLLTGTLRLGANSTGTKYVAGTYTDGVTINVANLDSFGGLSNPLTGARFTLSQ